MAGFRNNVKPVASDTLDELVNMLIDVGPNLLKLISWNKEDRKPIIFKNEVVPALDREAKSVVFYGEQYKAVFKLRRYHMEICYQKIE